MKVSLLAFHREFERLQSQFTVHSKGDYTMVEPNIAGGLIGGSLIGISSRYYFWNIQPELANYDRLLHTNWDCLCLGGILALVDFRKPFQRSIRTILPLGLLACSLLIYGNGLTQKHLLVNLFFAGIIFNILKNYWPIRFVFLNLF